MKNYRFPKLADELAPFAQLIDCVNNLSPILWSYEGDVIARKGAIAVPLTGKLSWTGRGGTSLLRGLERAPELLRARLEPSPVPTFREDDFLTVSPRSGAWQARQAYVAGVTRTADFAEQTTWADIRIDFLSLDIGNVGAQTPSHALLLAGVGFDLYPTAFPLFRDRPGDAVDGMVTEVFGRPALLRQLSEEKTAEPYVIIAYSGKPLDLEERNSVALTISFLSGQLGAIAGTIGIEGSDEIHRTLQANEPNGPPRKPPISWYLPIGRLPNIDKLPKLLPQMVEAMSQLRLQEGIPIDVALAHHLSRFRYLDMEIRDITLALDSLIEADAFKQKNTTIAPKQKYKRAVPDLRKAVDQVLRSHGFPDGVREKLFARLDERLRGANDVPHARRRQAFWNRIGFEPGPREKAALDLRHIVSHRGYLWLGKDGIKRLDGLTEQTRIARTFVNSVLLSLLGYRGDVLDYLVGANLPMAFRR